MSANPTHASAAPRQAPWEALIQNAMELWFQASCRSLRRALHGQRRNSLRCGTGARQLRDLGLAPADAPSRGNAFVNAEAQLGMVR